MACTITGQYTVWQKPVAKTISKQKSEEKIMSDNQLNEEKEIEPNIRISTKFEKKQKKSSGLKKIDLADIKKLPKSRMQV